MHAGYPDCGAALIVELDGPAVEIRARSSRAGHRHLHRKRRDGDPRRRRRRRARADLEGTQGRLRLDGADQPELLRAGRRDPADAAARRARADRRALRDVRAARRQRLPRRRRQPASAGAVRRHASRAPGIARSSSPGRSSRRASPRAARSPASTGSAPTRPATCRRCSAPARIVGDGPRPRRVRSTRPLQPGQGASDPAAVRRGARACTGRTPSRLAGLAERL